MSSLSSLFFQVTSSRRSGLSTKSKSSTTSGKVNHSASKVDTKSPTRGKKSPRKTATSKKKTTTSKGSKKSSPSKKSASGDKLWHTSSLSPPRRKAADSLGNMTQTLSRQSVVRAKSPRNVHSGDLTQEVSKREGKYT